jgi:hypothetical protein
MATALFRVHSRLTSRPNPAVSRASPGLDQRPVFFFLSPKDAFSAWKLLPKGAFCQRPSRQIRAVWPLCDGRYRHSGRVQGSCTVFRFVRGRHWAAAYI